MRIDQEWLNLIVEARELGLSIGEVKDFINKGPVSGSETGMSQREQKLWEQKHALEYLISTNTREKDKAIHEEGLKKVEQALLKYL
ncbi:DNA-binding anti-repressor SinI [Bacillus hwajinpoensis]|uniref:DNA-binding anti-repressor SinI n=1 Tax=Guptibacillus hwajinpoensis TaxID=208199 RepID=A0A845F3R1_9BACL|nr:anti-repressor SinI family protein [Pseudalkalibacillus hwajinpoensis]MYL65430.1 DNA-binding anti-repressor SinI [Pseudalkalibacillus hwajinpoensis]